MNHDDARPTEEDMARLCCRAATYCSGSDAKRQIYEMALERDCDCGDAHAGLALIFREEHESWQQAAACCRREGADPDLLRLCEEQAAETQAMYQYHGQKVTDLLRSQS